MIHSTLPPVYIKLNRFLCTLGWYAPWPVLWIIIRVAWEGKQSLLPPRGPAGSFCYAVSPMIHSNSSKCLQTVRRRYPDTTRRRKGGGIQTTAASEGTCSSYTHATDAMTCNAAAVNCSFITTFVKVLHFRLIEIILHLPRQTDSTGMGVRRKNMTQQLRS